MRQGQAVAVPDGDVHHSGGGQFLDQFGSECRGFRGTAAQAGAAAPRINLNTWRGFSISQYFTPFIKSWHMNIYSAMQKLVRPLLVQICTCEHNKNKKEDLRTMQMQLQMSNNKKVISSTFSWAAK